MARPGSAPPFGWQSVRSQHHLRLVFPRGQDGMYCTLHKNLNPRLRTDATAKTRDGTEACIKILYKQRTVRRAFSAQTKKPKKQMLESTNRLAHFNPCFKPADSDRSAVTKSKVAAQTFPSPFNKPLYSREEVQNIVNRVHQSKFPGTTIKLRNPKPMYTAISLENLVESVHKRNHGMGGGGSDNCPMRHPQRDTETLQHVQQCSKKYSAADVQAITERMYKFDSMRWPPESKNARAKPSDAPKPPPPVDYVPPKKYSAKEVDEITERMHRFNPQQWPPNSKDRKRTEAPRSRTYYPQWRRKGQKSSGGAGGGALEDLLSDDLSDDLSDLSLSDDEPNPAPEKKEV